MRLSSGQKKGGYVGISSNLEYKNGYMHYEEKYNLAKQQKVTIYRSTIFLAWTVRYRHHQQ